MEYILETGTSSVAQLEECLPSMNKALDWTPAWYKPRVVVHHCNPRTGEVEVGGPETQCHFQRVGLRPTWATHLNKQPNEQTLAICVCICVYVYVFISSRQLLVK